MSVTFDYLPEFERRAKSLEKKYKSFKSGLIDKIADDEPNRRENDQIGHRPSECFCFHAVFADKREHGRI